MDFLDQVKKQLQNMAESEKDAWILSRAKLTDTEKQKDFLLSLSGEKKIISMPSRTEIEEFCQKVRNGEIYLEYETHYYEFYDGRYTDDWKTWYNDPFQAADFLDRVFSGCRSLLLLGENREAAEILGQVLNLDFQLETAEDSEDSPEEDVFSIADADAEDLFSFPLRDAGEDWIRASARLLPESPAKESAKKLLSFFEHPACQKVKPEILLEEGIDLEIFMDMAEILEKEINELDRAVNGSAWSREIYRLHVKSEQKKNRLSNLRVKCLPLPPLNLASDTIRLTECWQRVRVLAEFLKFERQISDQKEIADIQNICQALLQWKNLGEESWENRSFILRDIIDNRFYEKLTCADIMKELAEALCTDKEEHLEYADLLDGTGLYAKEAAYLYHQYGRDEKYLSYLESRLGKQSGEYSALIAYYQTHGRKEDAQRVAQLGLENCREDLTDCFICLLLKAREEKDEAQFQKLLASAKRRKHVNFALVKAAVGI